MTTYGTLLLLSVATTACGSALGFIAGVNLTNADPIPSTNPLRGSPLKFDADPRQGGLSDLRPSECTTWPIQNTWTVRATADEICVDAVLHYAGNSPASSTDLPQWTFLGDANKASPIALKSAGPTRKIGICTKHPSNMAPQTNAVWEQVVGGCAPNGGVLTDASARLSIHEKTPAVDYDVAAWTFK